MCRECSANMWGLWRRWRMSQAGIGDWIPQYSVACNCLSLPGMSASDARVLKCKHWYLWYWYLQYLTLNELTCVTGPAVRLLDDQQCAVRSGSVHISVLDGALWDAWQVHCGMGEIGLSLSLFNRSVQIAVWYLWCWDLFYVILVCIRLHVIFVSCDCIMKCIFV